MVVVVVELPKQVTVAIIKPDAVQAGLVDEIIQKVFINYCMCMHDCSYKLNNNGKVLRSTYSVQSIANLLVFKVNQDVYCL